jgi:hypothetical protein
MLNITLRFHLAPDRMVIIEKYIANAGKNIRNKVLLHVVGGDVT